MNSSNQHEGDKMVKAELIENPQVPEETGLIAADNVPDVDVAIEQWDAYQKLCKGLLNETDYQEIIVKEKDEDGNYVKVKRHFKKKSAWQKLSRAFNVTAKTRATNRAIAELIGAGEVSAEEMSAEKVIAPNQSKFLKEDNS